MNLKGKEYPLSGELINFLFHLNFTTNKVKSLNKMLFENDKFIIIPIPFLFENNDKDILFLFIIKILLLNYLDYLII